jgi:hypothetical protein
LQQRKQIRTDVRGIFEAARFSTFSTVSAHSRRFRDTGYRQLLTHLRALIDDAL